MGRTVRNRALRWRSKGPGHFLSRNSTNAQKNGVMHLLYLLQRAVYHATNIVMSKVATEADALRLTAFL